jgi:organic radical activating enzyme
MSTPIRTLIFVLCLLLSDKTYAQELNRALFFAALSTGDTLKINEQIKKISQSNASEKQAYIGVLLMRKSEFVKGVKLKLALFKTGGKKLEEAIAHHKNNAEYRFLRLLIQENAPHVVNYRANISEDASMVRDQYARLVPETRKAVLDYCKKSNVLKAEELK